MLKFLKRERIYVWMVLCILAVNAMNAAQPHRKDHDTKSLSLKTFQEMGITEQKVKSFLESKKGSSVFFRYALSSMFFVFLLSLMLNAYFIFRRKKIELALSSHVSQVAWNISDVIRLAIIVIFTAYIIYAIGALLMSIFRIKMGINLRMIVATFFIDINALWAIIYFVVIKYKDRISSLGLTLSRIHKSIFSGILGYILILPALISALLISVFILDLLGYKPPSQPVFDVLMEEKRNNILLFLTIFISVLGPIIEEIFFRGFLYNAVKKRFGILMGAMASAAIFSILHSNLVGFLPIMVLGILMVYVYEWTGSLIASMTVHIIHNSVILGFVFFIKELLP